MPTAAAGFGLDPEFAKTLDKLLLECRAAGYDFRISQGLRTPQKQAEYYCRWSGHPPAKIDAEAHTLTAAGAPWLAAVLLSYRDIARSPKWLTNALPGAGWHQWGLAADCYCYRNGTMVGNGDDPCYKFYADAAIRRGLTAGYYFGHQDSGHVQGPAAAGATAVYTWAHIDQVMKERFGDREDVALSSSRGAGAPRAGAAAAGSFYKDDPAMRTARLQPSFVYTLPTGDDRLRGMVQSFNRIGGLVEALAAKVGIDPVAVLAVWYVESAGRPFTPGKPVLRFENHKFFDKWGHLHPTTFDEHFQFGGRNGIPPPRSKHHKYRKQAGDPWKPVHIDSQDREYDAFGLGESLGGTEAACWASSFGGPQIMGFNHDVCGYASATALRDEFAADERWQVVGFFDYCRSNNLIDEIRNHEWVRFGALYNGDGATYGPLIRKAFEKKDALLALPKTPNPPSG
jgi:N-acetylmuramidase/D-alanyl-D-alanine carboxypeptidase